MIRVAGEAGLLVETGSLAVSHRLDAVLRASRPAGVVEIVPGPETVLVVAPGADQGLLRARLDELLGEVLGAGPEARLRSGPGRRAGPGRRLWSFPSSMTGRISNPWPSWPGFRWTT